jgi:DNA-directed RNA polymerase subunit RPC12/RpoP
MSATSENTRIETHTEYSITRSRCLRCGASIPETEEEEDTELCRHCRRTLEPVSG